MIKYSAINKFTKKQLIVSDRDLDEYDTRLWDVQEYGCWQKEAKHPIAIVPIYTTDGEKQLVPIFTSNDLCGVYITKSRHLCRRKKLSKKQQIWMDAQTKGKAIFN